MQRLLAIVLTTAVAMTAVATPAIACVPETTVAGGHQHGCCGEQAVSPAPIGTCCAVSQPVRDRAVSQSRCAGDKDAIAAVASTGVAWHAANHESPPGPSRPSAVPSGYTVPIYLQQRSLLI